MIISEINLKKFEIRLKKPLWIKQHKIDFRQGILLIIKNQKGQAGYGEIAPLPGFHLEDLKNATGQIKKVADHLIGTEVNEDFTDTVKESMAPFKSLDLYPSVNFGLEMAILSIFYSQKDLNYFKAGNISKIPVNKLIQNDEIISKEYIKEIIFYYSKTVAKTDY